MLKPGRSSRSRRFSVKRRILLLHYRQVKPIASTAWAGQIHPAKLGCGRGCRAYWCDSLALLLRQSLCPEEKG